MTPAAARTVLTKIINVMRNYGMRIDSPYDVENFIGDWGSHSQMFETGCFEPKT
jgi:hypothetical protein